jgi:predicted nucleotidyltransferase component of viral defense system
MEISKKELLGEALKTGFRPGIMEKVWHLMAILDGISVHPFLRERLVLKGGTALNLFFFDLLRLSVDINLNYIGQLDRQEMLTESPEVEKALEAIFQREGLSIRRIPEKHAGGKWQLCNGGVLGGNGNLEVDLNYMFRVPLYEIDKKRSHSIGGRRTKEIPLLDLHELGAGKLSALFGRHASRDLFDAHQLLAKCSLDIERLRLAWLVYGAMGTKDWQHLSACLRGARK